MATRVRLEPAVDGVSAAVLTLRAELASGMREIAAFTAAERMISVCEGRDAIWAIIRLTGQGGLAVRAAHLPGGATRIRRLKRLPGDALRLEVTSAIGVQTLCFGHLPAELSVVRIRSELNPAAPLLIPFMSRDLYPLGSDDDPLTAVGRVEAAQRGLNSGLIFFHLDEPAFGTVLYFQNLTALNGYFLATKTKPDGSVGGRWPELGYLPPTPAQSGTPPIDPLPAGRSVTLSDAILVFHDHAACDEQEVALRFLQMSGAAYRVLDRPATAFRDWPARAEMTLKDLETAPEATIRHYGHRYIHPYTSAEYPDVMVQMSLIASIRDYANWQGKAFALDADLSAGLAKFHDTALGTMRRYLPNVGKDKDKDAVDSWYLYHPLLNLGRMALDGDARARHFFLASLDYAIRAARHFRYAWPIQFKVTDFSVIVEARNEDGLGQTDVGGLYAQVMLEAYDLTGEQRFLDEARAAIDAARDMRFELNYQANLTAWGAAACMRLWRITSERAYLRQSYVYLASFFHNSAIWESEIALARHYSNFLGVTCLHDAPYMAVYECFDSFAAFERCLKEGGTDLDPAARLLMCEYCKYALHRAWYYYPDSLPQDALSTENRNGHIDRKLSFPLEDLYHDGQLAGQVGQEIYGAGAAFIFASRSFHAVDGAPFQLFCDHFLLDRQRPSEHALSVQLSGTEGYEAAISIVRSKRHILPELVMTTAAGDRIRPRHRSTDRVDYVVPANARVTLVWSDSPKKRNR